MKREGKGRGRVGGDRGEREGGGDKEEKGRR